MCLYDALNILHARSALNAPDALHTRIAVNVLHVQIFPTTEKNVIYEQSLR